MINAPLAGVGSLTGMVEFISSERAQHLVRKEPVVFAEIMGEAKARPALEVHVMRPTGEVHALVARIAAAHGARYATIYPAEDRRPPPWAARRERRGTS